MTQHPAILTTEEAADKLRVHPETLRRWARTGKVESISLPTRVYRFRADVIDALIGPSDTQAADAGRAQSSFVLYLAVLLAAVFVGLTTQPGQALVVLGLAVVVGVIIREALGGHLRGMARLEAARHRGVIR